MKRLTVSSMVMLFVVNSTINAANTSQQQCSFDHDGSQTCTKEAEQSNGSSSVNDSNEKDKAGNDNESDGDKSEHCQVWAYRGECEINPAYMKVNCPIACKNNADTTTNEQRGKDLNDNCTHYAKLGECDVNPRFMKEFCAKSCYEYETEMLTKPSMKRRFTKAQNRLNNIKSDKCQLYMAESSIPNSGLGMYTAVPIKEGELVFHPEIIVSYFDNGVHAQRNFFYKKQESGDSDFERWKDFVGDKVDKNGMCSTWALQDEECDKNPNYMLKFCEKSCALFESGMLNGFDHEDNWLPQNYYWDAGTSDSIFEAEVTDSLVPGLGALANSHTGLVNVEMARPSIDNAGLHRSKDPGVGAFSTHYNHAWYAKNSIPAGMELFAGYGDNWFEGREETFGPIPLSHDFYEANSILKNFFKMVSPRDNFAQDFLTLTKNLVKRKHVGIAIPSELSEARRANDIGTAMTSVPNVIRSQKWLEQNGMCLDNIRPDQSTIPQAGRGAFATRNIDKGQIIAPLPLIHMDRERLRIYEENMSTQSYAYHEEQIMINYVYGHTNSSLVGFPYSPITNFVNHNFNHSAINVEIRWSPSKFHKADWLDKTVEEVFAEPYAGLMLEFVALRDIREGEEIFINYGREWEDAWNKHVKEWKPPEKLDHAPLYHLNSAKKILTIDEQKETPYPSEVMTVCFMHQDVMESAATSVNWNDKPVDAEDVSISNAFICSITSRRDEGEKGFYQVTAKAADYEESKHTMIVWNVPRHAIEFMYKPYESDQHLKGAFRHLISIPNDIFPSTWMNLK